MLIFVHRQHRDKRSEFLITTKTAYRYHFLDEWISSDTNQNRDAHLLEYVRLLGII